MATFIELDARTPDHNVTVAEIEVLDSASTVILESIAARLIGKTISQVKGDPGFSWWEDPVSEDTVIASAFVNRV